MVSCRSSNTAWAPPVARRRERHSTSASSNARSRGQYAANARSQYACSVSVIRTVAPPGVVTDPLDDRRWHLRHVRHVGDHPTLRGVPHEVQFRGELGQW
jgi:hypothetical protein